MQLSHLPDKTREYVIHGDDDVDGSLDPEVLVEGCLDAHETIKDYKKNKRRGMLGWFKSKVIIFHLS